MPPIFDGITQFFERRQAAQAQKKEAEAFAASMPAFFRSIDHSNADLMTSGKIKREMQQMKLFHGTIQILGMPKTRAESERMEFLYNRLSREFQKNPALKNNPNLEAEFLQAIETLKRHMPPQEIYKMLNSYEDLTVVIPHMARAVAVLGPQNEWPKASQDLFRNNSMSPQQAADFLINVEGNPAPPTVASAPPSVAAPSAPKPILNAQHLAASAAPATSKAQTTDPEVGQKDTHKLR